jgi:diguanylate cyclase (GGDEF)-like protein
MRFREVESRLAMRARNLLSVCNTVISNGARHRAGNPLRLRRFLLANWVLLVSLLMCGFLGLFNALVAYHPVHAAAQGAAFIGLAWNWTRLRRGARIDRVAGITSVIVGTMILIVIFIDPPNDAVLVWGPLFPAIPLFLLGPRIGFYHLAVFDALLFGGLGLSTAFDPAGYDGWSIIQTVAACLAMATLTLIYEHGRADTHRFLEDAANTDPLTGLLNRRGFRDRFETELARARRFGAPLSLLVLDLDHFKRINDRYGHDIGDIAIRHMADLLTANTRRHDVVGRLGGEEFALLLPETSGYQAGMMAEKLRQLVADSPLVLEDSFVPLTVSIGAAQTSREADQFDLLFSLADRRLYAAKEAGRNRVVSV